MLRLEVRMDACSSGARRKWFEAMGSLDIAASTEPMDLIGIVVSDAPTMVPDRAIAFAFATWCRTPSSSNATPIYVLVIAEKWWWIGGGCVGDIALNSRVPRCKGSSCRVFACEQGRYGGGYGGGGLRLRWLRWLRREVSDGEL